MAPKKHLQKNTKKRLVLLDSHAIIHRAYHALPDFTSANGEPTGALYGLSVMLLKMIADLNPDYLIAAYDLPEPTERHKAFDEYKAGRSKTDEALAHQIERSRDIFAAFNIPIYEKGGFEADDILATIVEMMKNKKSLEIVIASGDMDTLQLVSKKRVQVYTLKKGIKETIMYDEKGVNKRFGFGPTLLPDFKGFRGDPSDNIPGIPGIGEKTATILIQTFGSLEDIYKKLHKSEETFLEKGIKPRIVNLLKEHEEEARFSKMLGEIRTDAPISFSLPQKLWREGLDTGSVLQLFSELGFRTLSERFKGVFEVESEPVQEQIPEPEKEEVSDGEIREVSLALSVLDSEQHGATQEDILAYTQKDTFSAAKKYIVSELKKQKLMSVYTDIELPLVPLINRMHERGIRVDLDYLKKLSKKYHTELDKVVKKIYELVGEPFNINSPKQLGNILFDKLGLKGKGKTATGQRSTRESELEKLRDDHEIIPHILHYREIQKLLSTYIDNLPHMVDPADGRLHAEFLQNGTTTGRMSSKNPNLQNIPIRTEHGKKIREAFVAEKGHVFVALDYSQIELRIAAILSGDTEMIRIFKEGGDIHAEVARSVFGGENSDTRRKAKVINFGLLYGMGVTALGKSIGSTRKEATEYLKQYKETFTGLAEYLEGVKLDAMRTGYTETLFGRRRYFPGLQSHLPYVRAEAERMAINAPLQGTAADVIKIAMQHADEWIQKENLQEDVSLVLQVHDELVYEVREDSIDKMITGIQTCMEGVLDAEQRKDIPLLVDVSVGKTWGTLKTYKDN